jgi:hypothetical protein
VALLSYLLGDSLSRLFSSSVLSCSLLGSGHGNVCLFKDTNPN